MRNRCLLSVQVIFVVAGIDVNMTALDFKDAGRKAIDKVAVVRDHDHGSVESSDGFEQNILGPEIEVIGGLVEQEKICRAHQDASQGIAIALSA